ncbi:uncharacterized protein TEOVI_000409800 [Trypanosoma equiperdum]|uniref:Uncharacterized protein n=1 Tax=Trypanosoma equiperdum TaxID=5694 RepID=A0A1G4IJL1_TRYEQ|nr:hypothetical protein TEOVI_000409800 [Trypanosoma equiperdum]
MVEFFHYAALGHGSCCLVVNGGSTGNCPSGDKRGSVPTDCTLQPPQRTEGGLAEYRNPLAKEPSLTMGNSGNHGDPQNSVGCYITSTASGFTKKSFINELSGRLFYTQNNNVVANFTSVKKEFQNLIDQLSTSIGEIFTWNTSITGQRTILHSLLLKVEEEIKGILKRKERVKELTRTLGIVKRATWYESDGVRTQQTVSGVALLLVVLAVFWK